MKTEKNLRKLTAGEVMSEGVIVVEDTMSVRELAAFLTDHGISGAPVVDEKGRPVGVVSLTDIALDAARRSDMAADLANPDYYVRGWEEQLNPDELESFIVERFEDQDTLVREIMTPAVYSVDVATPVSEVARTMVSSRLHRLLVARGEKVVGIVTTMDLLKLLADS